MSAWPPRPADLTAARPARRVVVATGAPGACDSRWPIRVQLTGRGRRRAAWAGARRRGPQAPGAAHPPPPDAPRPARRPSPSGGQRQSAPPRQLLPCARGAARAAGRRPPAAQPPAACRAAGPGWPRATMEQPPRPCAVAFLAPLQSEPSQSSVTAEIAARTRPERAAGPESVAMARPARALALAALLLLCAQGENARAARGARPQRARRMDPRAARRAGA
jgi:hypothetical protein